MVFFDNTTGHKIYFGYFDMDLQSYESIELIISDWINVGIINYTYNKLLYVVTHPFLNFNVGNVKPPLEL